MSEITKYTHWYQSPIGWLIFFVILATVTSGVLMITISISDPDDIVIDDYYKQGLAINLSKARNTRALKLGIKADFVSTPRGLTVRVIGLKGTENSALRMYLQHPTRRRHDRQFRLPCGQDGCSSMISGIRHGRYYYAIEPQDRHWRLSGRLYIDGNRVRTIQD